MGDTNINLMGDCKHPLANDYLLMLQSNSFVSVIDKPTRATTSKTLIDHLITNDTEKILSPGVIHY